MSPKMQLGLHNLPCCKTALRPAAAAVHRQWRDRYPSRFVAATLRCLQIIPLQTCLLNTQSFTVTKKH